MADPKHRSVWPRGPSLDPRYSNCPYFIKQNKDHQKQSADSQNISGGCSVDQSPETTNESCESADMQNENNSKKINRIKFLLKPSKEGVKVLHQMQHATSQAARVMSQQLKGNVEIAHSGVVNLVGPATEAEIILDGRKVNSLLDSGSQVTSVS